MSVLITEECINCDACVDECPATAIVSADDSPLDDPEFTYVKPEKNVQSAWIALFQNVLTFVQLQELLYGICPIFKSSMSTICKGMKMGI